jgi:hypothetical protein
MSRNNEDLTVTNKIGLTLFTAGILAATALFVTFTPSIARAKPAITTVFSAQQTQVGNKKATPVSRPAQTRVAPQRIAPRVAEPRRTTPRMVTQPKTTQRVVRQPKVAPKFVAPTKTNRKVGSPTAAPRVVTPHGTRAVTSSRLRGVPARGAGRTVIRGQNYSAWRSGYRVRHGNNWRTFIALSALGAIAIGSSQYYPYAYISAPAPYCEGLTEDGCELVWQQVETTEGDVIDQCVAYCPWQ